LVGLLLLLLLLLGFVLMDRADSLFVLPSAAAAAVVLAVGLAKT
jgi:hypothetical protein